MLLDTIVIAFPVLVLSLDLPEEVSVTGVFDPGMCPLSIFRCCSAEVLLSCGALGYICLGAHVDCPLDNLLLNGRHHHHNHRENLYNAISYDIIILLY